MSLNFGPKTTSRAMTWCLDAGNTKSYTGTGSTWSNITGAGSNISLQNSPTWSSSGYFEFNGSTQYGSFVSPIASGAPMTVEGWVMRLSDSGVNEFFFTSSANGADNAFIFNTTIDQVGFIFCETNNTNNSGIYSGEALSLNEWVHFAGAIEGNRAAFWYNGNLIADNTYGFTIGHWYSTSWNIGRRTNNTAYGNCRIAQLRAYERFLTDAEVKQNYDSHKDRFGL